MPLQKALQEAAANAAKPWIWPGAQQQDGGQQGVLYEWEGFLLTRPPWQIPEIVRHRVRARIMEMEEEYERYLAAGVELQRQQEDLRPVMEDLRQEREEEEERSRPNDMEREAAAAKVASAQEREEEEEERSKTQERERAASATKPVMARRGAASAMPPWTWPRARRRGHGRHQQDGGQQAAAAQAAAVQERERAAAAAKATAVWVVDESDTDVDIVGGPFPPPLLLEGVAVAAVEAVESLVAAADSVMDSVPAEAPEQTHAKRARWAEEAAARDSVLFPRVLHVAVPAFKLSSSSRGYG